MSAPVKEIHPHPTGKNNRKVSPIWTKMGHYMGADGKLDLNSMVCMVCRTKLSYKSSTTIGKDHLRYKHGIIFEDNTWRCWSSSTGITSPGGMYINE